MRELFRMFRFIFKIQEIFLLTVVNAMIRIFTIENKEYNLLCIHTTVKFLFTCCNVWLLASTLFMRSTTLCQWMCVCVHGCIVQCCCRSEHARVTKLWLHMPIPVSVETKNTGTCSSIPSPSHWLFLCLLLLVSWLNACTQTFKNDWFCLCWHLMT